jgi:hypothetical protein
MEAMVILRRQPAWQLPLQNFLGFIAFITCRPKHIQHSRMRNHSSKMFSFACLLALCQSLIRAADVMGSEAASQS